MNDTMQSSPWPRRVRRTTSAGMVGLVLVLVWWSGAYSIATVSRILALGLLAASVTLITGHAGLPSLGQTAPFAVGGYTAALLAYHGHTLGLAQLGAAVLAATGFAAVTGLLLTHTRGSVHLMISVAVGFMTLTVAEQWSTVTGGGDGLPFLPATHPQPGLGELGTERAVYAYTATVTLLALGVTGWVLHGPAGILLRGVRDNEARMRASGHPTGRYLYTAHLAAGALAGLGGGMLVTAQRTITPGDADFTTASLALLACVLGGRTRLVGAVGGVAAILLVRDVVGGPFAGHALLLVGVLYIIAVYLLPISPGALWARLVAATHRRPRPGDTPAVEHPAADPATGDTATSRGAETGVGHAGAGS
jgi:branched-chain amino acid transport system permease protein